MLRLSHAGLLHLLHLLGLLHGLRGHLLEKLSYQDGIQVKFVVALKDLLKEPVLSFDRVEDGGFQFFGNLRVSEYRRELKHLLHVLRHHLIKLDIGLLFGFLVDCGGGDVELDADESSERNVGLFEEPSDGGSFFVIEDGLG